MSSIKVSVIVPAYNSAEFIHVCLDSLVAQTIDSLEVVAVNDGSADNTMDIIREYERKYPDIVKGYDKPNSGVADTRNFGVSHANGEFIGFVDSDDCVEPEFFEKLYDAAKKYGTDIAACNVIEIIGNESNVHVQNRIKQEGTISLEENPEKINLCRPYLWNKVIRREIFNEDNMFPYGIYYEDVAVIYGILFTADRIALVPDVHYIYRRLRDDSVSNSSDEKAFDVFKACDIIDERAHRLNDYSKIGKVIEWVIIVHIFIRVKRAYDNSNKDFKLKFIDRAYEYLDEKFPDWKSNQYYFSNKKNWIFKSKTLAKLVFVYCNFLPVKM
ncbi:MAG: glycosyltransferase [Acutalibacteraceae bacterium]